ncbi:hypothetical protein D4764_15G0006700 [Takifugu flavidus]|uniref:Uncharacterized protein n=1 Tax=Takifugu flavidus TaxID=433684 RepID=A0A5C6P2K2_9TELE|nr:hypothetical protein D4764_15G0006700 [Takifugu flavidus]
MSRGLSPRVNSYRGPLWILSAAIFAANVIEVNSYSCHEVKTAFQLRQVGPLSRVPETPRTGTADDTVDGGSKMSNISRSKDRNTEAATAQFLMGPESNLLLTRDREEQAGFQRESLDIQVVTDDMQAQKSEGANHCVLLEVRHALIFNENTYDVPIYSDVDLSVCKHQGPSCCTRKMEESYHIAVKRETIHNIHSYSYELEHLLSGHSDAFQESLGSFPSYLRSEHVCRIKIRSSTCPNQAKMENNNGATIETLV